MKENKENSSSPQNNKKYGAGEFIHSRGQKLTEKKFMIRTINASIHERLKVSIVAKTGWLIYGNCNHQLYQNEKFSAYLK